MGTSARIGFIVPSVNTVIEDELRELLPPDVSYSTGRVTLGTGDTRTQLEAFESTVPDEAGKLGHARCDAVVLACTSASILRGAGYDATLTSGIAERAGCPAISATAASVSALRALGAERVLVLTPYEEWLHVLEQDYMRAAGCDVVGGRLGTLPQHLGAVAPADLVREVIELVAAADARQDAVLVSCANARLFAAVPQLEDVVQVPVVTSNQAAAWAALHLVGRDTGDLPWGSLGKCSPLPARPEPPKQVLFGDEHVRRYLDTDGAEGYDWLGATILLLTTTGRRSGERRTKPLIFREWDGGYLVVASNSGADVPSAWFYNLQADPRAEVRIKNEIFRVTARVASPAERPPMWDRMVEVFPTYAEFQKHTERDIEVVMLERV